MRVGVCRILRIECAGFLGLIHGLGKGLHGLGSEDLGLGCGALQSGHQAVGQKSRMPISTHAGASYDAWFSNDEPRPLPKPGCWEIGFRQISLEIYILYHK